MTTRAMKREKRTDKKRTEGIKTGGGKLTENLKGIGKGRNRLDGITLEIVKHGTGG